MALILNHVTFSGNLTRDPEIKAVGQSSVAKFSLANSRRFKASDGEAKEETTFIECEVWGKQVEIAEKYLHKGNTCIVEGSLKQEQWQDKDGNKRSQIKIRVDRIHLVGGQKDGEKAQAEAQAEEPVRKPKIPTGGAAVEDAPPFSRSEWERSA